MAYPALESVCESSPFLGLGVFSCFMIILGNHLLVTIWLTCLLAPREPWEWSLKQHLDCMGSLKQWVLMYKKERQMGKKYLYTYTTMYYIRPPINHYQAESNRKEFVSCLLFLTDRISCMSVPFNSDSSGQCSWSAAMWDTCCKNWWENYRPFIINHHKTVPCQTHPALVK